MGFGDLKQVKGLEALDDFLLTRSYIEGLVDILTSSYLLFQFSAIKSRRRRI